MTANVLKRWAIVTAVAGSAGAGAYTWRHFDAEVRSIRARPTGAAIMVFGASVHDTAPSGELRSRLDHAFTLWQELAAPVCVVSGGIDRGVDEVDVMAQYLVDLGMPREAVVAGRPGHNTRASVDTMVRLGYPDYIAVSSPYHAYRIEAEARRRGVPVVVSAPQRTPETSRPRSHAVRFVTDMVGSAWYATPEWITRRIDVGRVRHTVPQLLTGNQLVPRGDGS